MAGSTANKGLLTAGPPSRWERAHPGQVQNPLRPGEAIEFGSGGGDDGGSDFVSLSRPAGGGGGGGRATRAAAPGPERFASLLRGYTRRNTALGDFSLAGAVASNESGWGRSRTVDPTEVNMLAASLSPDDTLAILGPASAGGAGSTYRPTQDELRFRAAHRLIAAGYDPRGGR